VLSPGTFHARRGLALGAAFAFAAAGARAQSAPPAPVPRLVCDQPAYDFGEREEREKIEHTFTIRNDGTADLVIRNVRTSCGCTVARPSTNLLPPGASAEIGATLSLAGRRGPQTKTISLESNDPAQPMFLLHMNGSVLTELALEPAFVSFGNLRSDAVASRDLRLLARRSDIRIVEAVCTSTCFRVEALPASPLRRCGL
jgi:hypothetical protein